MRIQIVRDEDSIITAIYLSNCAGTTEIAEFLVQIKLIEKKLINLYEEKME